MWRVAWRNLWRNRTRTLIVVLAISLTYALFLISMGIASDMYARMGQATVKVAGGNVLVHGDGFWAAQSGDILIEDPHAVFAALEGMTDVEAVFPRVLINGLLSSPRGSAGVRLSGIDPELETRLMNLGQYLVEGSFLAGDTDDPLVLGSGLVEDLEVEMGDRIVLTATDPNGEVLRALFRLSGIIETGTDAYDGSLAYTTVDAAQRALGVESALTQIGILTERDEARFELRDSLQAALAAGSGAPLEVLTWDEAVPEMKGYMELDANFNYIYAFIIFIVVGFGIANTFMMVVMERIRELGLLGALGLRPGRISLFLLQETLLLGLLSMAVGFAIGYGVHTLIATYGIDLASFGSEEVEISGVTLMETTLRSTLVPYKWIMASVGVLVLVFVSSLYPAWRVSRVVPAEAMRTFE